MSKNVTRRRTLQAVSGALVIASVGCLGTGRSQEFEAEDSESSGGTDTDDVTESVTHSDGHTSQSRDQIEGVSGPIQNRETATIIDQHDGEIQSDGDVVVSVDGEVDGDLYADGSVVLESGAEIDGSADVGEHSLLEENSEIDGDLVAGGDVLLSRGAEIDGNLHADRHVVLGPDSAIDGDLESGGRVLLQRDAEVDGRLEAAGTVHLERDSEVDGDVIGADVTVDDEADVDGEIFESE